MNFRPIFTPANIKRWIENNPEKLHHSESFGYQLEINRPFWFSEKSRAVIDNMPIFTGNSLEEVYFKMFKFCFENLKWENNDKKVILYDYLRPYSVSVRNRLGRGILSFDNFLTTTDGVKIELVAINNKIPNYNDYFIEDMLDEQLHFFGFHEDVSMGDCCFRLKKVRTI